jgi:hypothetical protein
VATSVMAYFQTQLNSNWLIETSPELINNLMLEVNVRFGDIGVLLTSLFNFVEVLLAFNSLFVSVFSVYCLVLESLHGLLTLLLNFSIINILDDNDLDLWICFH